MSFIKNIFGLLFITTLFLTGCKKDIDKFIPDDVIPTGRIVTTSIGGIITDENEIPLENVLIKVGTNETQTDENGIFQLQNIQTNDDLTFVQAIHDGYFHGSRTMQVIENSKNYVRIQLLEMVEVGTVKNADGGSVSFDGSASLTFPSNAVVFKDGGGSYDGDIHVMAKFLDPSNPNLPLFMPGDLRGITVNDQEQVLSSFGMVAVELFGDNGAELQVAEGKKVEIKTPVPQALMNQVTEYIPLWHFDENDGLWKEEGAAKLEGNFYVGEVSHFSFWNCDAPFPVVGLKGSVIDIDGNPLENVYVRITIVGEPYGRTGYTNSDGVFCGKIPKDKDLILEVFASHYCLQNIYTATIGPYDEAVILPPITIGSLDIINITLTGKLTDCDGDPVTNGYVRITNNNRTYGHLYVDADGSFEFTTSVCDSATYTLYGFDLDKFKQSLPISYHVTESGTYNLQSLVACDDIVDFIRYDLDGTFYEIPFPTIYPEAGNTYFWAYKDSSQTGGNDIVQINLAVAGENLSPGTYPLAIIQGTKPYFNVNEYYNSDDINISVTFSNYPSTSGDEFIGTFSGTFKTDDNDDGVFETSHTISGDFRSPLR